MSESFKGAMAEMREKVASPYWTNMADRLQKTHDHEMEQLRRSRFREGYVAGQRSMDAEHYQLKLRLQGLRFGDGSHENLSRLAYAIYPCPTGWGKESCEGLRDKLIELLGGVHDEPAQIPASLCACDADCDCCHGDETAVSEPLPNFSRTFAEPNLPKSAEIAKPESAGGGEVTITAELRKYAKTQAYPHNDRLRAIADRIDEQEHKLRKQRDELQKKLDEYERRDTAESIVRDIHLGKVTDSQAVERIRALP